MGRSPLVTLKSRKEEKSVSINFHIEGGSSRKRQRVFKTIQYKGNSKSILQKTKGVIKEGTRYSINLYKTN